MEKLKDILVGENVCQAIMERKIMNMQIFWFGLLGKSPIHKKTNTQANKTLLIVDIGGKYSKQVNNYVYSFIYSVIQQIFTYGILC